MSYDNRNMLNSDKNDVKKNNPLGIALFIPIIILILLFMFIPFVVTFFRSFTDYTIIKYTNVIMFKNYQRIVPNAYILKCIGNTILTLLISVPLTVGVTFLFAWLSSKIKRLYCYILSIMFLLVSVTSIAPIGLSAVLSSMNINKSVVMQNPVFIRLLLIMIPLFIGIGPLYLLFTICYIKKDNLIKYLHIAVSLQMVICVLSYFSLRLITGFPSLNYQAANLIEGIYDYTLLRFEVGYGSALMVVLAVLLIIFTILYNGIVWLIGKARNPVTTTQSGYTTETAGKEFNPALSFILFVVLFLISILLLSPFLQTIFDSFKSTSIQSVMLWPYFFNSLITLVISTLTLLSLSLLGSIGYHMLSSGVRKILTVFIIITFVLSPTVCMFISQNAINSNHLIFIVFPTLFRSSSFGLCVLLCTAITESTTHGYPLGKLLSSPAVIVNYLLGIFSVSLIASLAAWFNPLILSRNQETLSLYQLFYSMYTASLPGAQTAYLLVLSMLIPIVIIIIFTPVLLFSLSRKVATEKQ